MKALDRELQRQRIRQALPFIRPGSSVVDVGCHEGAFFDAAQPAATGDCIQPMGYARSDRVLTDDLVLAARYEIDIAGELHAVTARLKPES